MAKSGKVAPLVEKLIIAHSEQILIDMRREGIRPKAKMPNAWADSTASSPVKRLGTMPPGCGNWRIC